MEKIDYLCVGHVTRDLTPTGPTVGGTVTFSTRTAQVLGQRVAVLTSAEPDYDLSQVLPDVQVIVKPSVNTTTFENIYTPAGRRQVVHSVAEALGPADVPDNWCSTNILHLGPLNRELDPDLIGAIDCEMIALTPQGWHRGWDDDGQIKFVHWEAAAEILPMAAAVIVSWEDITDDETWEIYRRHSRILVITNGAAGSEVHYRGERRSFPPPKVTEVDPTGVGDIFAAAFFVRLCETGGDPWESACFATYVAAPTVTRSGLNSIPTTAEIAAVRAMSFPPC
jgi:sugar/nucleoside kinase (ribokinase family)